MLTVSCLECQQRINLGSDAKIGRRVTCQSCNAALEVVWLFPVCLDYLKISEQVSAYSDGSLE